MNSPPSRSDANAAFEALHPAVQRWIWLQGWPALRPVQARATGPVLARDGDVVITAPTAGGKTEAAFLPIVSHLASLEGDALRCLAIAPLKALINDQARRLQSLCESADLRIQPWHGDVTAGKANFWKRPAHILLTTPESLEAMLMGRAPQLAAACKDLRYVVVDELHAFMGNVRGAQLRSLLSRVEHLVGRRVPRVALSATLGEPRRAITFLRPDGGLPAQMIDERGHGGEIRVQVRAVIEQRPVKPTSEQDDVDAESDADVSGMHDVAEHLFDRLRGESHLVFANSRKNVEVVADLLRERCQSLGLPNEFFAHHGSLSRDLRMGLEDRLREGALPTTVACTSTLELGIDIGDVTSIAQIGPPPSVAALKQRIGRSGRRAGTAQILRQYLILPELEPTADLVDWLRLPLIQAIASVELMLKGSFEPPNEADLQLSTLVQQVLSVIAQCGGGATAAQLYAELCTNGAFSNVDRTLFVAVLRALGQSEVLEQVDGGALLPGRLGERMIADFHFYAAFATQEEYQVLDGGRRLGALPADQVPPVDQLLLFAGRRWKVLAVDQEQRSVLVTPARRGKAITFDGDAIAVHRIVHEAMRDLFTRGEAPAYLDAVARREFASATRAFKTFELAGAAAAVTSNGVLLAPWAGSRIGLTLALILLSKKVAAAPVGPFVRIRGNSAKDVTEALRGVLAEPAPDPLALADLVPVLEQDKHDPLLSRDVLRHGYAARNLDVAGALSRVAELLLLSPFA